jgi:hypothetical protein
MDQHIQEIAIRCYEALDCAHSLSCAILLRYGEYDQIAQRATDPHMFNSSNAYYRAISANDLLRKYPELPTTFSKSERAMDVWWWAERSCFRTNRFIWDAFEGENYSSPIVELFDDLEKIASSMLGRAPGDLEFRFGPGATYACRGVSSLLPNKVSKVPEMTESAWVFLQDVSQTAWFRCLVQRPFERPSLSLEFPVVRGNRFVTVPKDSKIDRGIAIEPSMNIFIQLGLGSAMRRSLNRHGLLRSNSQEIHRELARRASRDDSLATLDLSSASDTVSYELVKRMIPDRWFHLLDSSRSPMTQLPSGAWVKLEKFSSMGNGYTFELETLIFATICRHVSDKRSVVLTAENFSVYGDDIIVPAEIADDVVGLLRMLGFTPNPSKCFTRSPFRESCGGDYFLGDWVRPIQIKTIPATILDWFALHNMLRRNPFLSCLAHTVLSAVPRKMRSFGGPERLGDIVLHGVPAIESTQFSIRSIRCLKTSSKLTPLRRWDDHTALACLLYGVPSDGVASRNSPLSIRAGWVTDS